MSPGKERYCGQVSAVVHSVGAVLAHRASGADRLAVRLASASAISAGRDRRGRCAGLGQLVNPVAGARSAQGLISARLCKAVAPRSSIFRIVSRTILCLALFGFALAIAPAAEPTLSVPSNLHT